MNVKIKTTREVKDEFLATGMTISQWAKDHGYSYSSVQQVISGRSQNIRGKSHEIAVLLGIKDGKILKK